jgi:hypothetical protein
LPICAMHMVQEKSPMDIRRAGLGQNNFCGTATTHVDSRKLSTPDVGVTVLLNRKIWKLRGKPVNRAYAWKSGAAPATVSSELLPERSH